MEIQLSFPFFCNILSTFVLSDIMKLWKEREKNNKANTECLVTVCYIPRLKLLHEIGTVHYRVTWIALNAVLINTNSVREVNCLWGFLSLKEVQLVSLLQHISSFFFSLSMLFIIITQDRNIGYTSDWRLKLRTEFHPST